jgi:hypothetical protein
MSDFDEPWPKEMLIPEDSGFLQTRARSCEAKCLLTDRLYPSGLFACRLTESSRKDTVKEVEQNSTSPV